jgi:hypothetical protein
MLFVRLVFLLKKYTDSTTYFSVLFGNFVVGMKQVFDEQMVSLIIESLYAHILESENERLSVTQSV